MVAIANDPSNITLTLNGHIFRSFVAGDVVELTPDNDFSSQVDGTGGSVSIQKSSIADVYTLNLKILKHSDDDIFLNSRLNTVPMEILNGSLKENFTSDGIPGVDTWTLINGSIIKRPTNTINDVEGNAISEYGIRFRSVTRNL